MDGVVRIAVGSLFRNSAGRQVHRWLDQVAALRTYLKTDVVRAIAVEGDSTDDTRAHLVQGAAKRGLQLDLRTCNHGGPVYGSTESPARMAALSRVGNELLAGVDDNDDLLVYVESDLIWNPRTIAALTACVRRRVDVVAPLIFAGANFYDVWAFRKSGIRFGPFPPYHHELAPTGVTLVDSAGSCLVMRAEVARKIRFDGNALVGWCDAARAAGYTIGVAAELRVEHPA